ncbi:MAG: NifB/NifX family molybdenum-iron cluster-binding protein [Candidatus Brocadiaceae bacterium]
MPDWNGRISPVLDAARELVVVTVDKGREASRSVRGLEPGLIPQRARQLARLGVDVLICGGVSLPLLRMLEGIGIRVIPGISGDVNQVVHAYLSGRLTDGRFAMPGWRGRGGRRYRGGKGRWR